MAHTLPDWPVFVRLLSKQVSSQVPFVMDGDIPSESLLSYRDFGTRNGVFLNNVLLI